MLSGVKYAMSGGALTSVQFAGYFLFLGERGSNFAVIVSWGAIMHTYVCGGSVRSFFGVHFLLRGVHLAPPPPSMVETPIASPYSSGRA